MPAQHRCVLTCVDGESATFAVASRFGLPQFNASSLSALCWMIKASRTHHGTRVRTTAYANTHANMQRADAQATA